MTEQEYLIICMIEELAEVQKALSKCLRFTPGDKYQEHMLTNMEKAKQEYDEFITLAAIFQQKTKLRLISKPKELSAGLKEREKKYYHFLMRAKALKVVE